jgi:hypothetical protein
VQAKNKAKMPAKENKNEPQNNGPIVADLVGKKLFGARIAHHRHTGKRVPIHYTSYAFLFFILVFTSLTLFFAGRIAQAGPPQTQQGSISVSGVVPGPPPDQPAVITSPSNNSVVADSIITVKGICKASLVVEIYRNDVLAGSTICEADSFELSVNLLAGPNRLKARVYDTLGQYGPDSAEITVVYEVPAASEKASPPGVVTSEFIVTAKPLQHFLLQKQRLTVTYTISGGQKPYALAFNWDDNSEIEAVSAAEEGQYNIAYTYNKTGKRTVNISASDTLGAKTTFQFVIIVGPYTGVATPSISSAGCGTGSSPLSCFVSERIPGFVKIAWPALGIASLMTVSFWLGEKFMLARLRLPKLRT